MTKNPPTMLIVPNAIAITSSTCSRIPRASCISSSPPSSTIPWIAFVPDINGVCSVFGTFEITSKVPEHAARPLMPGTNAIHGIVLLGGLLLMHEAAGILEHVLLVIAIVLARSTSSARLFVTDRMLGMFKRKPDPPSDEEAKADLEVET